MSKVEDILKYLNPLVLDFKLFEDVNENKIDQDLLLIVLPFSCDFFNTTFKFSPLLPLLIEV